MEATYVVVGGGIAGMSCVEQISAFDPDSSIVMVSASPLIKTVTSVTPLTKMLVEFSVEEKSYEDMSSLYPSLTVIIDPAVTINSTNHLLTTASGTVIKYKKLCLCSGASPKIIADRNELVIGIRDTDSANVLQNKLKTARRVVVIGNGGIATELVHEIKGVDIIWAVKDKHISAAFVDPGASEFFQHRVHQEGENVPTVVRTLKCTTDSNTNSDKLGAALGPHWHDNIALANNDRNSSNIRIEYGVEVKSIFSQDSPEKWPIHIQLTNNQIHGCDFIVSATGVVPNSETITLEDGKFEIADDKGIKVNCRMQTNIQDVYAAGDVCTASWTPARHWLQMRLWTQARQMGAYAGKCMTDAVSGEETVQDFCFELFTHATRFFGYKVILLGLFNGQKLGTGYEIMLRMTKGKEYIKLVISEGKLQGAILIGDTDLEEMCENLILNQLDISDLGEDLLNPDIDIEDYFD